MWRKEIKNEICLNNFSKLENIATDIAVGIGEIFNFFAIIIVLKKLFYVIYDIIDNS